MEEEVKLLAVLMINNYISNLSIKNFRSYKDVNIDFHPGVNVIVGRNDAGKSNILRAINLLVNNQPGKADYISNFGGDLDIKMNIGSKTIGRFRNAVLDKKTNKWKAGTKNLYTLDDKEFNSFGRGKVPEIIMQHINLSPMNINFQMDGPFLLDKTPPDVVRHYNSLVNLTVIDDTLKNISATLRKQKADKSEQERIVGQKTDELKKYDWLANAEKDLSALEKKKGYIKKLNADWSILSKAIETLKKLKEEKEELQKIVKFKDISKTLISNSREIKSRQKEHSELSSRTDNLKRLTKQNTELRKILRHKDQVKKIIDRSNQIDILIDKEEELEKCITRLKKYYEAQKQYRNIIKYADQAKALLVLDDAIGKAIDRYNSLQKQLKNRLALDDRYNKLTENLQKLQTVFNELMPDQCPLCERTCNCK